MKAQAGKELEKNHNDIGLSMMALDDIEGAEKAFNTAIKLNGKYINSYVNMGLLLKRTKDFELLITSPNRDYNSLYEFELLAPEPGALELTEIKFQLNFYQPLQGQDDVLSIRFLNQTKF